MPEDKKQLFGDVSGTHYKKFLFLKGVQGNTRNGVALEEIIEAQYTDVLAKLAKGGVAVTLDTEV